jgi:hypothetical protein
MIQVIDCERSLLEYAFPEFFRNAGLEMLEGIWKCVFKAKLRCLEYGIGSRWLHKFITTEWTQDGWFPSETNNTLKTLVFEFTLILKSSLPWHFCVAITQICAVYNTSFVLFMGFNSKFSLSQHKNVNTESILTQEQHG